MFGLVASLDRAGPESRAWLNVGGWLTHGDLAFEATVDFLAVTEHRQVSAWMRSEWARLREEGIASSLAPASQESGLVGQAGVRVASLRGALLALSLLCHCPVS